MSRDIREHAGKSLLERFLPQVSKGKHKMGCAGVLVTPALLDSTSGETWDTIVKENSWLQTTKLVAKVDEFKHRGKAGRTAMCKEEQVEHVTGQLIS